MEQESVQQLPVGKYTITMERISVTAWLKSGIFAARLANATQNLIGNLDSYNIV